MIITISVMGTVIVALIHSNIRTHKKLKREEEESLLVMEEYCKLVVKYFYLTNNVEGLKVAEQRGMSVEALKNKEIEIKVIVK